MSAEVAACRSCGAPIYWLTIHPGGRRMPVDAEPAEDGTVMADLTVGRGVALSRDAVAEIRRAESEMGPDFHEPLYLSHFATCPQAKAWRKPR